MAHPYDRLTVIARPVSVLGVSSVLNYERAQLAHIQKMRAARPTLEVSDPWDAPDGAIAWVGGGKWIVTCVCGDAPSASPEWGVARCFNCGAVYRNITWPEDQRTIESVLCARASAYRNWKPGQAVSDLQAWNVAHGLKESI